jgi:hypothetical protein
MRRFAKFNGVSRNFGFLLKECERRWAKFADTFVAKLKTLLV